MGAADATDWREGVGPLTDGSVELVPVSEEHTTELAALIRGSADHIGRFMPWVKPDHSEDDVRDFLPFVRDGSELAFAVRRVGDPAVVGVCGLNRVSEENLTASLGYWLGEDHVGLGTATRAARLVLLWGADELGLRRIEILMVLGNLASRAVPRRLGLAEEGIRRDYLNLRGVQHDVHVFVALRDDVERLRAIDPDELARGG